MMIRRSFAIERLSISIMTGWCIPGGPPTMRPKHLVSWMTVFRFRQHSCTYGSWHHRSRVSGYHDRR